MDTVYDCYSKLDNCFKMLDTLENKTTEEQIKILTDYARLILDFIDVLEEQSILEQQKKQKEQSNEQNIIEV